MFETWKTRSNKKFDDGNAGGDVGQRFVEYLYYEKKQDDLRTQQLQQISKVCNIAYATSITIGG